MNKSRARARLLQRIVAWSLVSVTAASFAAKAGAVEEKLAVEPITVGTEVASGAVANTKRAKVERVELYTVEMPVEARGQKERRRSLKEALAEVFIRCTGDAGALENYPALSGSLASAGSMLRSYQYEEREVAVSPALESVDSELQPNDFAELKEESPTQLWLILQFDRRSVQSSMRLARAPFWQSRRPVLRVELDDRSLYESENAALIQAKLMQGMLERTAKRRGLPLAVSITQANVQVADSDREPILDKVEKLPDLTQYDLMEEADYERTSQPGISWTLEGEIAQVSDTYLGSWTLKQSDHALLPGASVSLRRQTLQTLVDRGIDLAVSAMARQFAIEDASSGTTDTQTLIVQGVQSSHDYLLLMKLLSEQPVFDGSLLQEADGDVLVFRLHQSAEPGKLRSLLNLSGYLYSDDSTDSLVFNWKRPD